MLNIQLVVDACRLRFVWRWSVWRRGFFFLSLQSGFGRGIGRAVGPELFLYWKVEILAEGGGQDKYY